MSEQRLCTPPQAQHSSPQDKGHPSAHSLLDQANSCALSIRLAPASGSEPKPPAWQQVLLLHLTFDTVAPCSAPFVWGQDMLGGY